MKKIEWVVWNLIFIALLAPGVAHATTMGYNLTHLNGNTYRYDYTVINDGSLESGVNVKLFDIVFDPAMYDEPSLALLSNSGISSEWSEMFLASAPGVPAQYDVYALADGVSGTTSGFAVQFAWLGGGAGPGSQAFVISDPDTFSTLEEGFTSLNNNPPVDPPTSPVPEPGTMLLTAMGLAFVGLVRRKLPK